jgi:phosphohistidine phosphatase
MLTHLWLIRHAKSSWSTGAPDFERPLNERGLRDGEKMRDWLSNQPWSAQWIWTSPAERARSTATFVHAAWPDAELNEEPRLYEASSDTILEVARSSPPRVARAAVVGHNPGMTAAVNELAGRRLIDNLPTFGVACFAFDEVGAHLLELTGPKRLD